MTGSIDPALVSRLSGEFTALGTGMGALGRDLEVLHRQVLAGAPAAGSSGGATRVVGDGPPPGSPTAGGRDASTGPAAPVPAPPSAAHATAPPA
ncbi:hypothetical protein IU505_35235, partial [Nocardia nova]|nr:hypothetical protein [Nocardia nova]